MKNRLHPADKKNSTLANYKYLKNCFSTVVCLPRICLKWFDKVVKDTKDSKSVTNANGVVASMHKTLGKLPRWRRRSTFFWALSFFAYITFILPHHPKHVSSHNDRLLSTISVIRVTLNIESDTLRLFPMAFQLAGSIATMGHLLKKPRVFGVVFFAWFYPIPLGDIVIWKGNEKGFLQATY